MSGASDGVGLCAQCRFAAVQKTRRGAAFWRCLRADEDTRFLRYPPLPVARCDGFEASEPKAPA